MDNLDFIDAIKNMDGISNLHRIDCKHLNENTYCYEASIPEDIKFDIVNKLALGKEYQKPIEIQVFLDRVSAWYEKGDQNIGLDILFQR